MAKLELNRNETPTPAPQDRGPLMDAKRVARELFHGVVNDRWVRDNVPGKLTLSHSKVVWYRADVLAWIEARREAKSA